MGPCLEGLGEQYQVGSPFAQQNLAFLLQPMFGRVSVVLEGIFESWKTDGWERQQMWASALALWLGLCCLLRPSGVLQLKVGDLSFSVPSLKTRGPGMVVVVRTQKL